MNQRGMSSSGQSAEVWGWLVAAHSRPPVHSGLARAARQSGLLYYPVRGLERAQNFKLLDRALLASDPRSRCSSPSHLGRKVVISDHFSVIRLPRCRVGTFTKNAPEKIGRSFQRAIARATAPCRVFDPVTNLRGNRAQDVSRRRGESSSKQAT